MNIKSFSMHFRVRYILTAIIIPLSLMVIYDYFKSIYNSSVIFALISREDIIIPDFIKNSKTHDADNKITLISINLLNNVNHTIDIDYIKIEFVDVFYGISSDFDATRYDNTIINNQLGHFDKDTNTLIFKGIKQIKANSNITIFFWGKVLDLPGIIEINSQLGLVPLYYTKSYGSLGLMRMLIAKNLGFISLIVFLSFIFIIIRNKK